MNNSPLSFPSALHPRKVRELSPYLTVKLIEDGVGRQLRLGCDTGLRKAGLPER